MIKLWSGDVPDILRANQTSRVTRHLLSRSHAVAICVGLGPALGKAAPMLVLGSKHSTKESSVVAHRGPLPCLTRASMYPDITAKGSSLIRILRTILMSERLYRIGLKLGCSATIQGFEAYFNDSIEPCPT